MLKTPAKNLQNILSIFIFTILATYISACEGPPPETAPENTEAGPAVETISITKLNEDQVAQYIAIQQSIKQMMDNKRVIDTPENKLALSRFQDIEKHAIKEQGMPVAQYNQIKDIIIETQTNIKLEDYTRLNNKIINLLEQTLKRHEATRSRVKSKEELVLLDQHASEIREHIHTLKTTMDQYTDNSETMRFNRKIIKPYIDQLNALSNTPSLDRPESSQIND